MSVFESANHLANVWVKDMMEVLGTTDPRRALSCLRAGLHALRDRLSVGEAADLAAQLPLLIRGLYFENWHPANKPLKIRKRDEFLALVARYYAPHREVLPAEIVRATFAVLGRHVTLGELADVVHSLPVGITQIAGR
jgi:uncharacterized protein (DUF2267 family)